MKRKTFDTKIAAACNVLQSLMARVSQNYQHISISIRHHHYVICRSMHISNFAEIEFRSMPFQLSFPTKMK